MRTTPTSIDRRPQSPFVLRPEAPGTRVRSIRPRIEYGAGRVEELREHGRTLEARVLGSSKEPYLVRLEHDGEELVPTCTCPFDWEPFCKHAIAALAARAGVETAPRGQRTRCGAGAARAAARGRPAGSSSPLSGNDVPGR